MPGRGWAAPRGRRTCAVKHWSNTGQTLVKHWSNTGQTVIKHCPNTGQTLTKHWSSTSQAAQQKTLAKTLVKTLAKAMADWLIETRRVSSGHGRVFYERAGAGGRAAGRPNRPHDLTSESLLTRPVTTFDHPSNMLVPAGGRRGGPTGHTRVDRLTRPSPHLTSQLAGAGRFRWSNMRGSNQEMAKHSMKW